MSDQERTVTTQAEVDQAIADQVKLLVVRGGTLLQPLQLSCGCHAVLWENSHAELWDSSHAVLRGSSHAELRGNSHALLLENSHAVLRGNSHAELWGNSHAELRGSSHAVLQGNGHAVLSRYAVAHQMPNHRGAVTGDGTVVVVPPIRTPHDWCDYYGVPVTDGIALVFKAVSAEYRSPRGTDYVPLTEVEAPDWEGGTAECGAGLHFLPSPMRTHEFLPSEWLTQRTVKYVACGVALADMAIHPHGTYPHKCQARRCMVLYECDRDGEPVTA